MYPYCPYQSTISSIFWLVRRVIQITIQYFRVDRYTLSSIFWLVRRALQVPIQYFRVDKSTVSSISWLVRRVAQAPIQHFLMDKGKTKRLIASTLAQESEQLAMGEDGALEDLMERDMDAIRWTLESLTDNDDFEPFVAGIPDFLSSEDITDNYTTMLNFLLDEKENPLGRRLLLLLDSCNQPGFLFKERRAVACIKALWALTSASIEHNDGDVIEKHWHHLLIDQRQESPDVEVPHPQLTPISVLREYARDSNEAISSRERLALILVAGKILQDAERLQDEAATSSKIYTEAFWQRISSTETETVQALFELVGLPLRERSAGTSEQVLAFSLLIVELAQGNPFGDLVLSHSPPCPRSVAGFFARRIGDGPIKPTIQRRLVRSLKFVVEQDKLKDADKKLKWDAVTEHFYLLQRLEDSTAIEEAIELVDWVGTVTETSDAIENQRRWLGSSLRSKLAEMQKKRVVPEPRMHHPSDVDPFIVEARKQRVGQASATMINPAEFTQQLQDLMKVVRDLAEAAQMLTTNLNVHHGAAMTPGLDAARNADHAVQGSSDATSREDDDHSGQDHSAPSVTPTTASSIGRADPQGISAVSMERIPTLDLNRAERGGRTMTESPVEVRVESGGADAVR